MKLREPDYGRLRELYVELEFHSLVKTTASAPQPESKSTRPATAYKTVDTIEGLEQFVSVARKAGQISVDIETLVDADSPQKNDPLRSKLVSLSIAVAPGEACYLPLGHVLQRDIQSDLLIDGLGGRAATDAPD